MININWKVKSFEELSNTELYDLLALRQLIFCVEQNCPYVDCDGKDQKSYHVMAFDETNKLVAYTRLLPKGVSYENEVSIGRVVTHPSYRGTGIGKILMQKSIEECEKIFGKQPIKIGAQEWLKSFYTSFGFNKVIERYYEDGIPHLIMVRE